ncbi:MAG TPA: ABC transporter substrate-binding protein [Candidatus Paceibacterota bacterium]
MRYLKNELLVFLALLVIAIVSFFGLIFEINKEFSYEVPAFGGTLKEGIIGSPRFINPLLAQTDADRSVASLIFSGLMRYDEEGKLTPALLEKYEISENGLEYTVTLKENLKWSNGKKLTVDDVIFTVQLAKNPLLQSPRRANWEGVEVNKIDNKTLLFRLQRQYAPFLDNLTLGILPKHLWEKVPPSQASFTKLNTEAVGAGPYKIKSTKRDSLGSIVSMQFSTNKNFVLGKPHIKTLILAFFKNEEEAIRNLKNGSVDSFGGISAKYIKEFRDKKLILALDLQRVIGVFLNQGQQKTLSSKNVRQALNLAIDKERLMKEVLGNYGTSINGPFPQNIAPNEGSKNFDPELAESLLGKKAEGLTLNITTADTPELIEIANFIKKSWQEIGIITEVKTFALADLEQLVIGPRRYDAFLYGEEIVGENPDPFAFWHSSQRTHPGYNIALYANSKVDKFLEEARTESNKEKRQEIYKNISKEISKDIPAIFLFSPSYVYVTPKNLKGMDIKTISTDSERFSTIHKWYLKKQQVWKIFAK